MSDSSPGLEDLFNVAVDLPPEARAAFLDRTCRDRPELRQELEELLRTDQAAADYFDDLTGAIIKAAPVELESAVQTRLQFGPYKAFQVIGRGGMGIVYRAERVDGEFDQQVALKLLHLDMETPETRSRFLAERQLLARMSHPNIARLLDGGVTTENRPYFVMELVDGVPIAHYCQEHALDVEAILRLFLNVIEAVAYLHRNLIVHRDLKPGNIFVDRDGQVKLLDFGIAKLLAEEQAVDDRTRTGLHLLTPEYAAPEQLTGAPITTATDVFALGGVLYELLTGRRPFDRDKHDLSELMHRVPTAPSAVLKAGTKVDRTVRDPSKMISVGSAVSWRRLVGDLDTICLKALRPEPEHRYATAEQLGRDIDRHLEGLPVEARNSTFYYRSTRFLMRNRRGVTITLVLLLALGFGFAHERGLRGEAELARLEADREAARALAVSDFLAELLSSVDPAKAQGQEVTVADVLNQASERLEEGGDFVDQPAVEAAVRLTIGNTYRSLSKWEESAVHIDRAVELEGGLDATSPEALKAIESLAALKLAHGEVEEAIRIVRKVFEVRSLTLGEDHPETLSTMNLLANALWSQGRYDEVETLDRQTLEIRRRVLGENHPDTLRSMNGLAATLYNTARYTEAADSFQAVLTAQKALLGDNHPDTLMVGNNLAACYLELGHYIDAENVLREVLEGRLRVLGDESPMTWTTMHNLGQSLALQARYQEAEAMLRQAAAHRQKGVADKEDYLFSRSYLADLVRDQGRYDEAESIYLATLKDQQERFGADAAHSLKTASGLAELRLRQGRTSDAEILIQDVLSTIDKAVGAQHPDNLGSLTILARIRNAQDKHKQALELSETVIVIADSAPAFDSEHPLVLEAQVEKIVALRGLEQFDTAAELAIEVHAAGARRLGAEHPRTVEALDLLQHE